MNSGIKSNILKLLLTVFLSVSYSIAQAQNNNMIDSLTQLLNTSTSDKERVTLYNELAYIQDSDSALVANYSSKAINLSKEINYPKGISDAYDNLGWAAILRGEYSSAVKIYNKAEKSAQEGSYKKGEANALRGLGIVYYSQGNYPLSLDYYHKALKINEEIGNKSGLASNYNSISNIYYSERNYESAIEYYQKALDLNQEQGDKNGEALSYNNLGAVYFDKGNYHLALDFYKKSLTIRNDLGSKSEIAMSYNNIGEAYHKLNDYPNAIKNNEKALALWNEDGARQYIAYALNGLGMTYNSLNKYDKALKYLKEGYRRAADVGMVDIIEKSAKNLSETYAGLGDYKNAFSYQKIYKNMFDSLRNEETTRQIVSKSMQYEFDKKEAIAAAEQEKQDLIQQQKLERKNYLLYGGSILLLGIVVVAFLLFRGYKQKRAANILLAEQNDEIMQQSKEIGLQRDKITIESQKSEKLLLNILPLETAQELKEKGFATPQAYEKVSVLFTDFKGFSKIAEHMSEEELVDNLDYCFRAFDHIIKKNGLEKIKTIGDAYMCAGGIPKPNDSNPLDAVKAAKEMIDFIQDWRSDKQARGEEAWELRIGIHTGKVVAGVVGEDKFAYDIWGDAVNTAARMESSGESMRINISGDTYEFVKNVLNCEYRGKILAKNKGKIDMYFVNDFIVHHEAGDTFHT